MVLDSSAYALAHLRLDGRRWNELRRLHAQISTQAAADGSSYLEMGNTKVICTVSGPSEGKRTAGSAQDDKAQIVVDISVAGFSGLERKKRSRGDKRTQEMQYTIQGAFAPVLLTHLYPHSTITVSLYVLSQDGGLLAALVNASTLALIDAGIPMTDYIVACTTGSTASYNAGRGSGGGTAIDVDVADPLLDLNSLEEQDLPFLTIGTLGATDSVSVLVMETRMQVSRLEEMMAVGIDGCRRIRELLDDVVRDHGKKILSSERG